MLNECHPPCGSNWNIWVPIEQRCWQVSYTWRVALCVRVCVCVFVRSVLFYRHRLWCWLQSKQGACVSLSFHSPMYDQAQLLPWGYLSPHHSTDTTHTTVTDVIDGRTIRFLLRHGIKREFIVFCYYSTESNVCVSANCLPVLYFYAWVDEWWYFFVGSFVSNVSFELYI
jgi:hypothetical protein